MNNNDYQRVMDTSSSNMDTMSSQSTPAASPKMTFKMQQRLQQQQSNEQQRPESPAMTRGQQQMRNKMTMKAQSTTDLRHSQEHQQQQLELLQMQQMQLQQQQQQPNQQMSLMLHQQQQFPQHNLPAEQMMYQQFNQKPMMNQLMKLQPHCNASLADFRSIMQNPSVNDLLASKEQLNAIVNAQKHSDYIVSDYMDKIATRINLLETELKFAWRALDLLSGEYGKMWQRLDKLENLTIEQQNVLTNLLNLYNNQSQEHSKAQAAAAQATQIFLIDPNDMIMNPENYDESYGQQQGVVIDQTTTEFNEMLEDLKNEAIIDGLRGSNRNIGKIKNAPLTAALFNAAQVAAAANASATSGGSGGSGNKNAQFQGQETGCEYEGNVDYESLMNFCKQQPGKDARANFQFFRNLLRDDFIKDGLEEGVDFLQSKDAIKQHQLQQQHAMELLTNYGDQQFNMEVDFFRSGELNKNLFRASQETDSFRLDTTNSTDAMLSGMSQVASSLDMIYEDNEEKANNDETSAKDGSLSSPLADKLNTDTSAKKNDNNDLLNSTGSGFDDKNTGTTSCRKTKVKKKKHHQQLQQQQQFQIQQLQQLDDTLIQEVVEEILQAENLTNLLNKDQLDELKAVIKLDIKLFNDLKKLDKNYIMLLINPSHTTLASQSSHHASMSLAEEDQKFTELIGKIKKNVGILKKVMDTTDQKDDDYRHTSSSLMLDCNESDASVNQLINSYSLTASKSSLSSNLYNDDEYFQSLKKSLERHNSMLMLLHMQNPSLNQKNTVDFLSDEQLDNESSSPPPPAPNGDASFCYDTDSYNLEQEFSSMNPFHIDILLMQQEQQKQKLQQHQQLPDANNLSPYRSKNTATGMLSTSPRNTKSDSGLSSMSGFSSFEKSPNSPKASTTFTPYEYQQQYRNMRANNISSQEYLRILTNYQQLKQQQQQLHHQQQQQHAEESFMFDDDDDDDGGDVAGCLGNTSDSIYSEENLNYIKELSQNVPICSIYENKSIFDNIKNIKPPSAWETYMKNQQQQDNQQQQQQYMKSYPDLVLSQDQENASGGSGNQQPRLESLMEQKKLINQQKLQLKQEQLNQKLKRAQTKQKTLIDHLVYYPSPMSITDYNSSMNLEYQREYPEIRPSVYQQILINQQNLQQHQQTSQNGQAPIEIKHEQQQPPPQQRQKSSHDKSQHSYLNKVGAWLPDIKLKRISKRHRSQSLPVRVDIDNDNSYEAQKAYKMNLKQQRQLQKQQQQQLLQQQQQQQHHHDGHGHVGKKGDIHLMNNYMKRKKKQIVSTMSNIMSKAKVYRRHSFSHHMSDDDNNEIPSGTGGGGGGNSSGGSVGGQVMFEQSVQQPHATRSMGSVPNKKSYSDTETDISSMFSDGDDNDNSMSEYERNQKHQEQFQMTSVSAHHQQLLTTQSQVQSQSQSQPPQQLPITPQPEAMSMFATMGDSLPKYMESGDSDKNSSGESAIKDLSAGSQGSGSRSRKHEQGTTEQQNQFNLNFSSTSMEFAVSRKVGIFRKKSSITDDQPTLPTSTTTTSTASPTNYNYNAMEQQLQMLSPPDYPISASSSNGGIAKKIPTSSHMLLKTHSIYVDSIDDEKSETSVGGNNSKLLSSGSKDQLPPSHSPRLGFSRSNSIKQGNSLDVPGYKEDEDNRSQHSFKTISSSRRQSTEDSIDTDDEYFYYEMRNLEELERNSHMESILQDNKNDIINNIIQLDKSLDEPDDSVRVQMGFVLHELKSKVKLRENQAAEKGNQSASKKHVDIFDKFTVATMPWNRDDDDDDDDDNGGDTKYLDELNQIELEMHDYNYGKVKKKRKKAKSPKSNHKKSSSSSTDEAEDDKSYNSNFEHDAHHLGVEHFDRHSQSSGVTSGPDSPIQSDDDTIGSNASNNLESQPKLTEGYDEFKMRQKNAKLSDNTQQQPQYDHGDDRGAKHQRQVQTGTDGISTETELNRAATSKTESSEEGTATTPGDNGQRKTSKPELSSQTVSTDSTNQDSGISDASGGNAMMSSKWKLLKTLKERKEKTNQVKIDEEKEAKDKDSKVSTID